MTITQNQDLPHEQPDDAPTPAAAAPVPEQLETPGTRQRRELDEMRNLAKRLEALEPKSRKRVLDWLVAHFGDS